MRARNITIAAILFVVLQLVGIVFSVIGGGFDLAWIVENVLMMALAVVLACTYRSHTKNIMKPLIGAALVLLTDSELVLAAQYVQYYDILFFGVYAAIPIIFVALQVLLGLLILAIFIIHCLINAKHESSPGLVKANKILYIIFAVIVVLQVIMAVLGNPSAISVVSRVASVISDLFLLAEIILIEGRLDSFRQEREEKQAAEAMLEG